MPISRRGRAELVRQAARIRQDHQRHGAPVQVIADEIVRRLPVLSALEAWRLAYGWSRPRVVDGVAALFEEDGLAAPGLTSAMLCRWEHGGVHPSPDYTDALARLYRVPPWRLGLCLAQTPRAGWYRRHIQHPMQGGTVDHSRMRAVTDSVALQLEVEGPSGGPQTRDLLHQALDYYTRHYGDHPPAVVASEIHRCRSFVVGALGHGQSDADRRELRRLAGWLSALLGNLAFHVGDTSGAHIHLGTGARIGVEVGEHRLAGWSLGAQSMVASFEDRPHDALELARQAGEYADSPLRRAQMAAWCELRPTARLGNRSEVAQVAAKAQRSMDSAPGEEPGRFGFDTAELHLHLAEAHLDIANPQQAAEHARSSIALKPPGSGGWAAATVLLARAHAARHSADDACGLGMSVLDAVPADSLRMTTRRRLTELQTDLEHQTRPGPRTRQFRDRMAVLPALTVPKRTSPEPNGH